MTASTLAVPRSSSVQWFTKFLRDELSPYPGRSAKVARMLLAATIVMIIVMVFRIPFGAYAALFALTISRENPDATVRAVRTLVVSFAVGVVYVLVGAVIFSSEPVLRLVWVLATLFLIFFSLSAVSNSTAVSRFGYLLVITIPIWDRHISGEQKVEESLWAAGAIALASIVVAAVELIYAGLYRFDEVTAALLDRLRWVENALRGWSGGLTDPTAEQQLARLAVLGTSRMRRDLLLSSYAPEVTQQMGAVVSLVGRLVDLAANLSHFSAQRSDDARRSFQELANRVDILARGLAAGEAPQEMEERVKTTGTPSTTFLLMDMERTIADTAAVLRGSDLPSSLRVSARPREPRKPFFVADAFTNPSHIRFAIRGSLAAAVCYLAYNLANWPEISTAVTTCLLTALTTIGSSRQKQVLRFGGAIAGGTAGMCAQIFVMPGLDSITGLVVLFAAITTLAAWIITSGPRISYFGAQFAFAFYLINFEEFRFQTSLAVARDRVVGILLGLVVMWLIFDQLWGAPAITEMRRTFLSTLKLLARFMMEPASSGPFDQSAAIEQSYVQRERINTNFNKLREAGDGVMMEFGSSREHDLALRNRLVKWQLQVRVIFITRIALLKYRLRLAGFELPEPILSAQHVFDSRLAERMDDIADHLQGKRNLAQRQWDPLLPLILETIEKYRPADASPAIAARLQSLLPLCSRIDLDVMLLADEIAASL
jgi:multidrug resistance protein MdtO